MTTLRFTAKCFPSQHRRLDEITGRLLRNVQRADRVLEGQLRVVEGTPPGSRAVSQRSDPVPLRPVQDVHPWSATRTPAGQRWTPGWGPGVSYVVATVRSSLLQTLQLGRDQARIPHFKPRHQCRSFEIVEARALMLLSPGTGSRGHEHRCPRSHYLDASPPVYGPG